MDSYFIALVRTVALRSNCRKRAVGALIALDNRIVSTGYNGTPHGFKNCVDGGCLRCKTARGGEDYALCYCCHAEENAIVQAARYGIKVNGGTMWSTLSPCLPCARMLVNAGISSLNYLEAWQSGQAALELLIDCGLFVRRMNG